MEKFKPFDRFVCVEDTREIQANGFRIVATVQSDRDSRPTDSECYSAEQVEAWFAGDWDFVGIVLSVYVDDFLLVKNAASLWGIEANFPDSDNGYLSEAADELLDKAIEEGKIAARKLAESLAKTAA